MGYLFQFYFACLILNIIALPICYKLFSKFKDGGAMIGKSIGLYICGYLMWIFSSAEMIKFNESSSIICIIVVGLISYGLIIYQIYKKKNLGFVDYLKEHWKSMVIGELIFLLAFIYINWIFAHRIPATDTERMMDLGFMMTMSKTDYMPPLDMWAAGEYINYYYFGQYIITYLTKVAMIPVSYGYTFGMYLIPVWAMIAVFRLVQAITGSKAAGCISSIAVVFAGNFHYIVFNCIAPMLWDILRIQGDKPRYWFADSTRYIGYVPEVPYDRTIHEFPAYSFMVGDLHAHVVNILVVVVILTALWAYLSSVKEKLTSETRILEACINPYFLLIGFLIGISSMSNYWDFPIYFVVSGSVILFGMIMALGLRKKVAGYIALSGAFIMMIILFVSMPFNLKFHKMVQGIGIVESRSLFYQYLMLWGFPVIMSVLFIVYLIKKKTINESRLYILLLCLCATGLTLIPEFIFVKDIYIDAFPRANTMFKLTYEAFIMFGIALGCIIYHFYSVSKEESGYISAHYKKIALIGLFFVLWTGCYSITSVKLWFGELSEENYVGYDASATIKEYNAYELDAIDRLVEIVEAGDIKQPVVLEADGDSYSNTCRVSVLTGYPTVLGWHTHEWLWHNSHSYMEVRRLDVEKMYSGEDMAEKKAIVNEYGIDYIFIGLKEYEKYEIVQNTLLEELGEVVFCEACESGEIIEIIKVDR